MEDGIECNMTTKRYNEIVETTEKKALIGYNKLFICDKYTFLIGKSLLDSNNNLIQIKNIICESNELFNVTNNYLDFHYKIFMSDGNVLCFKKFKEITNIYSNILHI